MILQREYLYMIITDDIALSVLFLSLSPAIQSISVNGSSTINHAAFSCMGVPRLDDSWIVTRGQPAIKDNGNVPTIPTERE